MENFNISRISLPGVLAGIMLVLFLFSGDINAQVDNDFWFVVPELSHRGNTGGTPGTLRIATLELPATVTISMPANTYHPTLNPTGFQDIVVDIAAKSTAAIDLTPFIDVASNPTNNRLENKPLYNDGINKFGLHITATNKITAYWEVNYDYGSDLWTLKGSNGLGTLFYTPFQTFYNNRNLNPKTYSAIDIVATTDNTQVTITLPPGKAASYGALLTPIAPGGFITVDLERGETFSVFPLNYSIAAADHLAGTRIESNEPIAVTVKDDAVASGSQGQDVVGDQLVPVDIVGTNYIVPEIGNPNHVYVLATEDNTNIYVYDALGLPIGTSPYVTLNQGQQGLVIIPGGSKFARITSTLNPGDPLKPFYVFQMGVENQSRGGALIPAIGCTGNTQVAFTRARDDNKFYMFIIVEKGNEDKFLFDGVRRDDLIDPLGFTDIAGSGNWVAQYTNSLNTGFISVGQHLVENTGGIFHLGILNGFPGASKGMLYYGYYSDFGGLNIGANVAGTNSSVVRACYGDPVQLYAYGGTTYQWTPDTYLDDATSNLPTAINLPPGAHNYSVEVSGACASATLSLTVLVASPVKGFFSTSATSGCSPLEVEFKDQSEGVFSWQYDMGDGTPLIRYDLDPATPYPEPPGYPANFTIDRTYPNTSDTIVEYQVTLMVKNESGCADILTRTITVFPEIQSGFSLAGDSRGCDPLPVQFQNNSSGDTDTWLWEFGDGGSSIDQSPAHTFRNIFGPDSITFETRLIAISPYLCRDTSYQDITVMPYIEADFAFDTVSACTPHEIVISNQSIGADTCHWDFGDGTNLTSPGPKIVHTYVNPGPGIKTFTLKLRVVNKEGCSDEIEREVTVYPEISGAFLFSTDEGCSPFEVVFQNNSSGAATYLWDFGDGGTSTEKDPVHLYDKNLMDHDTSYHVKMLATSAELCRDSAEMDVLIHPYIEAAFTVEDIVGCDPFVVTIKNQSFGATTYSWSFGDGKPGSSTSAAEFTHIYENNGTTTATYTLRLIVENAQGCSDTLERIITVHPEITASFTTGTFVGCHPLEAVFTNLSDNAELNYWDFGDGGSSTEESPTHTFYNFGTSDSLYTITLTTSTLDGECVKSVSWQIRVHPYVQAEFTFPLAADCSPFEVSFNNLSIGGANYNWNFGDGHSENTVGNGSVTHTFTNTSYLVDSIYTVLLTATSNEGCISQKTKKVTAYPRIRSSFDVSDPEGCQPLPVTFTNTSNGAGSYVWDFGDGATSSVVSPLNTYTNTGTADSIFSVSLIAIASNATCRDTSYATVKVHPYIKALFSMPDNTGCNPFSPVLENASENGISYYWTFGDSKDTTTLDTSPITHLFENSGFISQAEYEIVLEATSLAGCKDVYSRSVYVEPDIIASFTPDQATGCNPLTVSFTDLSQGVLDYFWDFDDGSSSQLSEPVYTFTNNSANEAVYRVWLYTTAPNHLCRDSAWVDITVHPFISAGFTFDDGVACSPSLVTFENTSINGTTYFWDFGDNLDSTTLSTDPINHVFVNNDHDNFGTYNVVLRAENSAGCSKEITRTVEVYPAVDAGFSMSTDEGCHPLDVSFTNESEGGFTYLWDLGDGATINTFSPDYTYENFTDAPVTNAITLTTFSRYNCSDQATAQVTIHPKPRAGIEPDKIMDCPPFNAGIANTSINADSYFWEYGDGITETTLTTDTVWHPYLNNTQSTAEYTLKMTARSNFGCSDFVTQKFYIYPPTTAEFSSNQEGCSPFTAYFINESTLGAQFKWDFGDGGIATTLNTVHNYFNFSGRDTSYEVTLTTTSALGCKDTISHEVAVYTQPQAEFYPDPTYQNYPDATVTLTNLSSQGDQKYLWSMDDGTQFFQETPAPYTYDTWGNYDIKLVVNTGHCIDSISHEIIIFPSVPQAAFDTVFPDCEPYTLIFVNRSIYGNSYLWEFGDGGTSTELSPMHTYEKAGYYRVKLTVTGDGGYDITYGIVLVYNRPAVDFKITPDIVMLPDQTIQCHNLTEFASTYRWSFGDGGTSTDENPNYLYTETGVYDITLEAWSDEGCSEILTKNQIISVLAEGEIVFPNAFKPDMNGPSGGYFDLQASEYNYIFHPLWDGVIEYNLKIYTRWGEQIFESEDVNIGWDGYINGNLASQAVYVWICSGKYANGQSFKKTGDVTLLHHNREPGML